MKSMEERRFYQSQIEKIQPDSTIQIDTPDFNSSNEFNKQNIQDNLRDARKQTFLEKNKRDIINGLIVAAIIGFLGAGIGLWGDVQVIKTIIDHHESDISEIKTSQQDKLDEFDVDIRNDLNEQKQQITLINQFVNEINDSINNLNLNLNELLIRLEFVEKKIDGK
jgi:hypothetical protein